MATLATIAARVRSEIGDYEGAVYDLTRVISMVRAAQDEVVARLRACSVSVTRHATTTLTVPANTLSLGTGTTPPLPSGLVVPIKLTEAKVGGAADSYVPMYGPSVLPVMAKQDTLNYWDWYENTIWFVGSTAARSVKIDFYGTLADLSYTGDEIVIVGSELPIVELAKKRIVESQGDLTTGALFDQRAQRYIDEIATEHAKAQQSAPGRRQPIRGIGRYLRGA